MAAPDAWKRVTNPEKQATRPTDANLNIPQLSAPRPGLPAQLRRFALHLWIFKIDSRLFAAHSDHFVTLFSNLSPSQACRIGNCASRITNCALFVTRQARRMACVTVS